MRDASSADTLLDWYDAHARVLPWRVGPSDRRVGVSPDPYRVWLSEIMLQQTTVAAVKSYYLRFIELWPTVQRLAAAEDAAVMAEWAGLGYYARARNLLKCARVLTHDFNGRFPEDYAALLDLPGIGPYTAAAISAIAFDRPVTVVDGNVERVVARLFAVEDPVPASKSALAAHAETLTPRLRPGDHAQAMMDLGATICTPRNPTCGICPLMDGCEARARGIAADLPRKLPKKAKPTRLGTVYVARREDGAFLVETRAEKGLLGGMLGWPGTEWSDHASEDAPPVDAAWTPLGEEVRHTFTHFHLKLSVQTAVLGNDAVPLRGRFIARREFRPSDMPTVMRKAYDLASETLAAQAEQEEAAGSPD